jgi:hypothetical protein
MNLFGPAGDDAPMASPLTSRTAAPLQFPPKPSTPTPKMGKGKKKRMSTAAQLSPPAPCNYPSSQSPYPHGSPQDHFWLQRMLSRQSEPSPAPPAASPAPKKEPIPPPECTHTGNMLEMLLCSCKILCDWTGKTWSSPRDQMHIVR